MLRFRASSGRQILIARFKRANPKQALNREQLAAAARRADLNAAAPAQTDGCAGLKRKGTSALGPLAHNH
jgi:hypothetical protein